MQLHVLLLGAGVSVALACDSGLDWNEKQPENSSSTTTTKLVVDRSAWPAHMREQAERVMQSDGSWPFGADATSFAATIIWHKMEPTNGGNVFVSNFLNEGCGSGYVGAQWHAGTDQMFADWAIWDIGDYTTAYPMCKECVRYDGEGHGTQCGVLPGHTWEVETPYIFNVSLVGTNASGAHFAGFIKNNKSGEVLKVNILSVNLCSHPCKLLCTHIFVVAVVCDPNSWAKFSLALRQKASTTVRG